ncbi:MAG: hypothetical protein U5L01_06560 [Rheinheimera sp.]|nr:hypothetical protein [Rheinheimera sp.]
MSKLLPYLSSNDDVSILVKGSRSAKMELVVQDLLESCQQEKDPC